MQDELRRLQARRLLGCGLYRLYAPANPKDAKGSGEDGDDFSLRIDSAGNVRADDGADRGGEEE